MRGRCRRLALAALGALTFTGALVTRVTASDCAMPSRPRALQPASVVRVADGDTIVVETAAGQHLRVRLIGVDTPELHVTDKLRRDAERSGGDAAAIRALGERAAAFTRTHLAGRRVELERDAAAIDRHGRALAYVWVGQELFNVVLVRDGYAGVLTVPPNVKYAGVLAACHREARQGRRGLWALGPAAAGGP